MNKKLFVGLMLAVLVVSTGCTVTRSPELLGKMLMRGRTTLDFMDVDVNGTDSSVDYYNMNAEAMQFITPNLALGGRLGYNGYSGDIDFNILNLGPSVAYTFDMPEHPGIVPFVGGSLGIAKGKFGTESENGLYIAFEGGAMFFITETWSIDALMSYTMQSMGDVDIGAFRFGAGLTVYFENLQ